MHHRKRFSNRPDPAIALTACWKLVTIVQIPSGWMTGKSSILKGTHLQQPLGIHKTTLVAAIETAVKIADLTVERGVVALAANADPSYDYYLLKVKSDRVEKLTGDVTDDIGSIYTTGQEVLRGHLFL